MPSPAIAIHLRPSSPRPTSGSRATSPSRNEINSWSDCWRICTSRTGPGGPGFSPADGMAGAWLGPRVVGGNVDVVDVVVVDGDGDVDVVDGGGVVVVALVYT